MSKSIKFFTICLFLLMFTSCATFATRIVTCEREIWSKYGEINKKQRLALGEKVYSEDYDKVFTSCITGLAQLGLAVKNMERESGYILGEGPNPVSIEKQRELIVEYLDELSTCGRKWSFVPGNAQESFTFTILRLNKNKTKVKLRISTVAITGNYEAKYFSVFPNLYEKMYLDTWESIEKQIAKEQEIKDTFVVENKTKGFDVLYANAKTPAKFYVGNETINVHFGDKILYVIKNDPDSYFKPDYLFSSQLPIEFRSRLAVQNKYLKIDDQTKVVKFASNSENILTIDADGNFKVKRPGNVIITISVDDNFVQIPLKIIGIPLTRGITRDRVIELLGVPDKVNKKYIGWVESAYIDGIFYYPDTDNGSGISVEHWIYKKYPNAILRFGYSGLSSCVMASWGKLSTKMYTLEH